MYNSKIITNGLRNVKSREEIRVRLFLPDTNPGCMDNNQHYSFSIWSGLWRGPAHGSSQEDRAWWYIIQGQYR